MKKIILLLFLLLLPSVTALSDFIYKDGVLMQQSEDSILTDMTPLTSKLNLLAFAAGDQVKAESKEIAKDQLTKSCIIAFNRDGRITEIYNCETTKATDLSEFIQRSSGYLQAGKGCGISMDESLKIDAKLSTDLRETSPCTVKILKNEYSGFSAAKFKLEEETKSGAFVISKDGKLEKAALFMTESKDLVFDEVKYRLAKNIVILYDKKVSLDFTYKPESFELFATEGKKTRSLGKIKGEGLVNVEKNGDGSYIIDGKVGIADGDTIIKSDGKIFYTSKEEIIADKNTNVLVFTKGKGGVNVETGLEPVAITICAKDLMKSSVDFCKGKEEVLKAKGKGFKVTEIEAIVDAKGDLTPLGLRYGINSRLLCSYNFIEKCYVKETTPIIVPGMGFFLNDGSLTVKRNGKGDPSIVMDGAVEFSNELYTLAKAKESLYLTSGSTDFIPAKDAKLVFTGAGVSGVVEDGVTCIGKKLEESCKDASVIVRPGKKEPAVSTASGAFGWPVSIVGINYLSQCTHNGNDIDLALAENTPLYAIDGGIVTEVCSSDKKNCYCAGKPCPSGCGKCGLNGNHVQVETKINGKSFSSLYIHMKKVIVKEGDSVVKGQLLGASGNTGFSAGPHTHWRLSTADFGSESTNPLCLYDDKFLENVFYKTGTARDCKKISSCDSINPNMKKESIA